MIRTLLVLGAIMLATPALAQDKLQVVASFSILADITAHVAGDAAEVHTLVGPNNDVHEYQPTPADTALLAHADLIIVNGLGLEGWLDRLIAASDTHATLIVATHGITPLMHGNTPDPHAWQSLKNVHIYVHNIRDALSLHAPKQAEYFAYNATRYEHELDTLSTWVDAQLDTIPDKNRVIITSHDAFGYLGQEYNIRLIAPQGLTSESEPSAAALAHLVDQVRLMHASVVFLENVTDPRLMTMLQHEAGATLGGTLYSDALSAPGGVAADFLSLYRHNMLLLIAAMQRK